MSHFRLFSTMISFSDGREATRALTSFLVAIWHAAEFPGVFGPRRWQLLLLRSAGTSCGASFAPADAAGDAVASRPGTRCRGFVALGVEATFDESRGITDVIPVRFEHQTVDAQTAVLQNPKGIESSQARTIHGWYRSAVAMAIDALADFTPEKKMRLARRPVNANEKQEKSTS